MNSDPTKDGMLRRKNKKFGTSTVCKHFYGNRCYPTNANTDGSFRTWDRTEMCTYTQIMLCEKSVAPDQNNP